jgi:hypothetical protein
MPDDETKINIRSEKLDLTMDFEKLGSNDLYFLKQIKALEEKLEDPRLTYKQLVGRSIATHQTLINLTERSLKQEKIVRKLITLKINETTLGKTVYTDDYEELLATLSGTSTKEAEAHGSAYLCTLPSILHHQCSYRKEAEAKAELQCPHTFDWFHDQHNPVIEKRIKRDMAKKLREYLVQWSKDDTNGAVLAERLFNFIDNELSGDSDETAKEECKIPDDCMKCKYKSTTTPDGDCPHVFHPIRQEGDET